jgi:hypothetical protein
MRAYYLWYESQHPTTACGVGRIASPVTPTRVTKVLETVRKYLNGRASR